MRGQVAGLLEGGATHITVESPLLAVHHPMQFHARLVLELQSTGAIIADIPTLAVIRRDGAARAGRRAIRVLWQQLLAASQQRYA